MSVVVVLVFIKQQHYSWYFKQQSIKGEEFANRFIMFDYS